MPGAPRAPEAPRATETLRAAGSTEIPGAEPTKPTRPRLWDRNFILLWQGQAVSTLGDVFYQVALGFWVLAVTGSTGLMGALMAASTVPRVVLGPFAGVLVDRLNRKWIMVLMDTLRGTAITLVAVLAFAGRLEVWMVFAAGVLIGLCAAFFDPSVRSSIPDIVDRQRLLQGNSAFGMIESLSGILGNSLGGVIYSVLGAPVMFLVNGISYLFSAGTELFLKIPRVIHQNREFNYLQDLREGMRFIRDTPVLGLFFINVGMLNFFLSMGGVLFLPYFQRSPGLGPAQYGTAMAVVTAGSVAALLILSGVTIPHSKKVPVFIIGASLFALMRSTIFFSHAGAVMLTQFFIMGFTVAVVNSIISTTMQLLIPSQMRGKVFGLMGALGGGLIPLGMALGGVLAEVIPIRVILTVTGLITGLGFLPVFLSSHARRFIAGQNPEASEE